MGMRSDGGMGEEDWTRLTTRDNPHDDLTWTLSNTAPGAPHRSEISDRRIRTPPQFPPPPLGRRTVTVRNTNRQSPQTHWLRLPVPPLGAYPHHYTRYSVGMAEPTWQETLRNRLVDRNAKESAYSTIIEQCTCPFPCPAHTHLFSAQS